MQVSALHQQSAQWVMPAQGKSSAEREKDASPVDNAATKGAQSSPANNDSSGSIKSKPTTSDTLSQEQLDMITQLKARDAEVRAHEAAHLAAAGSYATSGDFYKIAVPMVRRTFPELIAHEIVGVQPMTGPVGSVGSVTGES
jgi:hypothetical protein